MVRMPDRYSEKQKIFRHMGCLGAAQIYFWYSWGALHQRVKVKTTDIKILAQRPGDVHIFGYTADAHDIKRAEMLRSNWPELTVETPLIERGIDKAACLALLKTAGISPPRTYLLGFPNANCIPCCKAQSPAYWALVRRHYPTQFYRMADLSRRLKAKLTKLKGERAYIDEIPDDHPTTDPIAPACDMICQLAERDLLIP